MSEYILHLIKRTPLSGNNWEDSGEATVNADSPAAAVTALAAQRGLVVVSAEQMADMRLVVDGVDKYWQGHKGPIFDIQAMLDAKDRLKAALTPAPSAPVPPPPEGTGALFTGPLHEVKVKPVEKPAPPQEPDSHNSLKRRIKTLRGEVAELREWRDSVDESLQQLATHKHDTSWPNITK